MVFLQGRCVDICIYEQDFDHLVIDQTIAQLQVTSLPAIE